MLDVSLRFARKHLAKSVCDGNCVEGAAVVDFGRPRKRDEFSNHVDLLRSIIGDRDVDGEVPGLDPIKTLARRRVDFDRDHPRGGAEAREEAGKRT